MYRCELNYFKDNVKSKTNSVSITSFNRSGKCINSISMSDLFGLLLVVVQTLRLARAHCTEYYVILERNTYFDPDLKSNLTDITTHTLTNALLNYPMFNTTEEYSIIQNNKKCMLDLTCDDFKSSTACTRKVIPTNIQSIEQFESAVPKSTTTTKLTTVTLSTPTKLDDTTPSQPTTPPESTTKETSKPTIDTTTKLTTLTTTVNLTKTTLTLLTTTTKSPKIIEPPKPEELTPVTILSTASELTTTEVTTITESKNSEPTKKTPEEIDKAKADYLEKERKEKERVKIGVIVASALISGTMMAIAVKKILDARKYGSYRIPESNIDESAV